MMVTAVGGFTVLAPGGTKTVDKDFWQTGGGTGKAFGWALSFTGMKNDFNGISTAVSGVKTDHAFFANSQSAVSVKNRGLQFENTGLAVYVATAKIYNAVMNIFP
jgi:type VI secretion system secreted protein VgrG